MEKKIVDVQTGEVEIAEEDSILFSNGIGSCVVVAFYATDPKIGGLAHIMLPGKAPADYASKDTRYAANALESLSAKFRARGILLHEIRACYAGGGNVLQKTDDTICLDNIASVENLLVQSGIPIAERAAGGICRRSVKLDIASGDFFVAEGDSEERFLCNLSRHRQRGLPPLDSVRNSLRQNR